MDFLAADALESIEVAPRRRQAARRPTRKKTLDPDIIDPPETPDDLDRGEGYSGLVSDSLALKLGLPQFFSADAKLQRVTWVGEHGAWKNARLRSRPNETVRVGYMVRLVLHIELRTGSARSDLPGLAAQAQLEDVSARCRISWVGFPDGRVPAKYRLDWEPLSIDNYRNYLEQAQGLRDHIAKNSRWIKMAVIGGDVRTTATDWSMTERAVGHLAALEVVGRGAVQQEEILRHVNALRPGSDQAGQAALAALEALKRDHSDPDVWATIAQKQLNGLKVSRGGWFSS